MTSINFNAFLLFKTVGRHLNFIERHRSAECRICQRLKKLYLRVFIAFLICRCFINMENVNIVEQKNDIFAQYKIRAKEARDEILASYKHMVENIR